MSKLINDAQELEIIWDLEEKDNRIYKVLCGLYPEIEKSIKTLQGKCPVATSCDTFRDEQFFRLKGHARSFCMNVGDGVFVFKGSEPFTHDYMSIYKKSWLHPVDENPSKIENFVMYEHEVYLALTRKSALSCAEITKKFVIDFYNHTNMLPKMPIPLRVFLIPEPITQNYLNSTKPFLSNRAQFSVSNYTKTLASDGLAIYLYYYDGYPLRAGHLVGQFPGGDDVWKKGISSKSLDQFDLHSIIKDWVTLVANMLGVGYLPTTWIHTGNCVQIQNLVMDGGMCDADSIEPIVNLNSGREIARALLLSITTLAKSIATLQSTDLQLVFSSIWSELSQQIKLNPYNLNYNHNILKLFNSSGLEIIEEFNNILSVTPDFITKDI